MVKIKPNPFIVLYWIIPELIAIYIGIPLLLLILAIMHVSHLIILSCNVYTLNDETLDEQSGVFSTSLEQIKYFRIKSVRIEKPFFLRIMGLSNVYVKSSEPYKPELKLYAIDNGEMVMETIKDLAKEDRALHNVKEYDVYDI